jgi:hypothetical protein
MRFASLHSPQRAWSETPRAPRRYEHISFFYARVPFAASDVSFISAGARGGRGVALIVTIRRVRDLESSLME